MKWAPLCLCGPVFLLAVWGVWKQVRIRLEMAHWEARQRVKDWGYEGTD